MEDKSDEVSFSVTSVPSYASGMSTSCEAVDVSADMGLNLSTAEDTENIVPEDHDDDGDHAHHHDDDHDDHHDDEHKERGPQTRREKLREFLHTQKFHIAIIVLVVLDCAFVIGELILDYEALANAKCPADEPHPDENATSGHGESDTEEGGHELSPTQEAAEALHYLSLIILSIFMIELILKLVALGTKFFHSKLEVFDAIIIVVSFILDIITLIFPESFAIVDLIVILRLWRIIRIVNGVVLSVEQRAEKRVNHHKRVKARAVEAAMSFEKYSTALEEEIQTLRDLLETNGVKIDESLFKSRPEKPHYDRKYHMTGEDGDHHHHHFHLPFHGHKKHAHGATNDNSTAELQPDDGRPPDYDALHQGNHEANC